MTPTHRLRFDLGSWVDVAFVRAGFGMFDVVSVAEGELVGTYDKNRKLYSWDILETQRNYQIEMIQTPERKPKT